MPSLLFFQQGLPCSSHNSPHIMSTVMWCSIVWNEGAMSCSTAQCVCRHQTVLRRSPLSSLYLTVWGGHIIPTTLIYSNHCTHSLVSDMVQCPLLSIIHTHTMHEQSRVEYTHCSHNTHTHKHTHTHTHTECKEGSTLLHPTTHMYTLGHAMYVLFYDCTHTLLQPSCRHTYFDLVTVAMRVYVDILYNSHTISGSE